MNAKTIYSGAFILFAGNLLSSVLGLGREVLSAAYYGANVDMDAYLFANTIPSIVLSFFGGILMGGFIPLFIKKRVENEEEASNLFSNAMNWVVVIVLLLTAGLYALSDQVASLFAIDAASHQTIERLFWILLPSILFFGLSYAQSAVLNSMNHFTMPALLTVMNNLVVIGFMVAFHRSLGIYSVAIGFVIGTALQVVVQWPVMRRMGVRYRLHLTWRDEHLKRLVAMSLPIIGLVTIDQAIVFATRYFAAYLDPGSASSINYANRFVMLPVTLFGTALISATYPTVVTLIAERRKRDYNEIVTTTVKSLSLLLAPIMLTCMAFAPQLIQLLLERGAFDQKATEMTSIAFLVLSIGILVIPVREFFMKLFFGQEKMKVPIFTSLIYMAVFIGSCFALIPRLKHMGIVLSTAVAMVASLSFLILQYIRMDKGNRIGLPIGYVVKIGSSAILSAVAARLGYQAIMTVPAAQHAGPVFLLLSLCGSLLLYFLLVKWLGIQEIGFVYDKLSAKFNVRKRRSQAAVSKG
ncbi:murein biosynthesis integral membrane protein MurJ [Cohnella nanjingensis]|uniref:Murein biosynthesis integral membrane protein MurJ n=1 Tax=Cohnella nanjingensis TaxID=1387779 RepID=A0A7X0RSJ1_9BACL|nr:murein biosynthesis integral membrane protein MurJ [Cohnella nanjingensis]MBB6671686.1 murein biosynthesis integral membrane protein MurJ [Cohnella nanjingensis]